MSCSEEEIDKISKRELKSSALRAGEEPAVHSPCGALWREPWARLSKERSHRDDTRSSVEDVPSFKGASLQHQPPPGRLCFLLEPALCVRGGGVLSWGCCNKRPQTRCLKNQTATVSRFWRPEVQHRGIGWAACLLGAQGKNPSLSVLVAPGFPGLVEQATP